MALSVPCLHGNCLLSGPFRKHRAFAQYTTLRSHKSLSERHAAVSSPRNRSPRPGSSIMMKATADPSEDRSLYRLIEVTLRKPMGLVLTEAKDKKAVVVEEVVEGGNADQSGQVQVGDIVTKCSATVLKAGKGGQYEKEGYGQRPYDNWEKVMFDCDGEDFDTVMAAIGSNTERWGIFTVTLVLKRYAISNQPA